MLLLVCEWSEHTVLHITSCAESDVLYITVQIKLLRYHNLFMLRAKDLLYTYKLSMHFLNVYLF